MWVIWGLFIILVSSYSLDFPEVKCEPADLLFLREERVNSPLVFNNFYVCGKSAH